MALIAYIASVPAIGPNFDLVVTVQYFDDNDPANTGIDATHPPAHVLLTESWSFPATVTGIALQTAVKDVILERGGDFARARAAQASAAQVLPAGALVAIT